MLKQLINFYKVSSPKFCSGESLSDTKRRMKFLKWSTFLAATLGYGMYYVCRLSLNVVTKYAEKFRLTFTVKQNYILLGNRIGNYWCRTFLHIRCRQVCKRIHSRPQ